MNNADIVFNFWLGVGFFAFLGIGLLVDIILFTFYWDKIPNLFRKRTAEVSWCIKDIIKVCVALVLVYFSINSAWYAVLKIYPLAKERIKHIANVISGIGMYGAGLLFIIYFLKTKYNVNFKSFGIRWKSWIKGSFKGLLFYIGFIPIFIALTYLGLVYCNFSGIQPQPHPLVDILKKERTVWVVCYLIISAVLIGPMFEEILFRGLIYQGLKRQLGIIKAALISGAVFSLMHLNASQFLPVMGLGMLFCFVFEYTGSLIPAIVLHIFNNGFFLGLFFVLKEYL